MNVLNQYDHSSDRTSYLGIYLQNEGDRDGSWAVWIFQSVSCVVPMQGISTQKAAFIYQRFTEDWHGTQTTQYINTKGLVTPWPDSLVVQVSSDNM